jgi:hypothetical protein
MDSKGAPRYSRNGSPLDLPMTSMTPDEVPRMFYAKYFRSQKAIIEQKLLSNGEINEMEKQELKHLCKMIGHFITEFNNQMIWKMQQPLKIFLGNFSMKLISQIKDDLPPLNKDLTQTFLNRDLRKLVLDKYTARKCGILYLHHLVIDKGEIQCENINDDDMPLSPISNYGMVSINVQQIYPSFLLKSRGQVKGRLGIDESCFSCSSPDC